jgi:hypothetical protein
VVVRLGVPVVDDYLEFLAGRCGRTRCWRGRARDEHGGAARLSSISGLFAFLQARGDVSGTPVPRG